MTTIEIELIPAPSDGKCPVDPDTLVVYQWPAGHRALVRAGTLLWDEAGAFYAPVTVKKHEPVMEHRYIYVIDDPDRAPRAYSPVSYSMSRWLAPEDGFICIRLTYHDGVFVSAEVMP